MAAEDKRKLEILLNRFYKEIKEDKEPRNVAKEQIKPPLDFMVEKGIGDDPKYAKMTGIVGRSYQGSGTYGTSDFDVHIPMTTPEGAQIEVLNGPVVSMKVAELDNNWKPVSGEGGIISAQKIRQDLWEKFSKAAAEWDTEHGEELQIDVEKLPKGVAPFTVKITPHGKNSLALDCLPVLSTEGLAGLESVKETIKSPNNGFRWPQEEESRQQIADQILLLPAGDTPFWKISLMLGHKKMVKDLDDGGVTCRLQLYRVLKMINKHYWNISLSDQEMIKLGMHCVQNVFFNELSKYPEKEQWDDNQLVPRFKYLLIEIRQRFAQGDVKEYMLPGAVNLMAPYKQTAFLSPKLGGMVRRMESTVKDPAKVLETLITKFRNSGQKKQP